VVEEEGARQTDDSISARDRAQRVEHRFHRCQAQRVEERAYRLDFFLEIDRQERDLGMRDSRALQDRELGAAGHTPRCPEVEHDDAAALTHKLLDPARAVDPLKVGRRGTKPHACSGRSVTEDDRDYLRAGW